jgi:hypothetical protein
MSNSNIKVQLASDVRTDPVQIFVELSLQDGRILRISKKLKVS